MPTVTLIASAVAVAIVAAGWRLGFWSPAAYLLFATSCGAVLATAVRLVRAIWPWRGVVDAVLRAGVVGFALVVLTGLLLGSARLIAPVPFLLVALAGLAAAMLGLPTRTAAPIAAGAPPAAAAIALGSILAFVVAVGFLESPLTLYDSLSYHLFFPARWLQEHRLFLIATPFSDEAQAYAPGNGELFFLWLMVPFHGDLVARVGQIPFYLLIAGALYALGRRLGVEPAHAAYVPAFFLLSRPIVEQAAGADVDLVCWAMFLATIYLGFVALDSRDRRDWALWGVAAGLYFGTKYVSLVYSPIVFAIPLLRGPRREVIWGLPGLLVFAAPWYVRNWIIAGSPIYPSSIAVAGLTIAQGAFSRAAMSNSVFHTTDPRLLPVMIAHAFGTPLALFWAPLAAVGVWQMRRAHARREAALLLLAPPAMVALYWIGVPDNVDSRFLLPAAMLALLPLAFLFRIGRAQPVIHVLFGAGLCWLAIGYRAELPVALPWFMGGWLSLEGIVARAALVPFLIVTLAIAIVYAATRHRRIAVPAVAATVAAASAALVVRAPRCDDPSCRLLTLSSTFIRPTMLEAWRWTAANVRGASIAYSGNNLPYPLAGDQLVNRVRYVNIDRHRDWLFHDYDRAHRRRRDDSPPVDPLATPSGVLKPLPGPPRWHVDAVRPRYERLDGDRTAWLANLKSLAVDRLFVSSLSAYEVDYVAHDAEGFPIEDGWARADPSAFTLLFQNPQIRIYAVHPP